MAHDPSCKASLRLLRLLAEQGFNSREDAQMMLLQLLGEYFKGRSSFFARQKPADQQLEVLVAYNVAGCQHFAPGMLIPLTGDSAHPDAPMSWLDDSILLSLPIGSSLMLIPVRIAEAEPLGVLGLLDPPSYPLEPIHKMVLETVASRMAHEIHHHSQIEQAIALKNQFVSIVSHEFRTALMSILGFSQLLRDETCSPAQIHEYVTDIHVDAERISRMINDLLDLDRLKTGCILLRMEIVDLNGLLRDLAGRVATAQPEHPVQLDLDPTLQVAYADGDKLIQVFTNLISNAIKYSPQSGIITIGSAMQGSMIHCWVQDQGIGIPAEAIEHIFLPYARVESKTTRYIQGTGLGLPIVREIVQMHGGQVWAESKLGKGSTFHVTLLTTASAEAA